MKRRSKLVEPVVLSIDAFLKRLNKSGSDRITERIRNNHNSIVFVVLSEDTLQMKLYTDAQQIENEEIHIIKFYPGDFQ